MKPCDICLEKECKAKGGVGSCRCETCAVRAECNKKLTATIRMTLKCTQSCSHCCFECSPKKEGHMTVSTAKNIAKFITTNEIQRINLMGGEVFCNPDWREILDILIPTVKHTRIVSNGDWAVAAPEFAEHLTKFGDTCHVAISKDDWHTNKNIKKAASLLEKNNILQLTSDLKENESTLVPVGRAQFTFGIYSMMGCWCQNPAHHYSFLIDEVGKIYKCGFGVWDYADIHDYLNGGFPSRFKEFTKAFYDTFIPSCKSCHRAYQSIEK